MRNLLAIVVVAGVLFASPTEADAATAGLAYSEDTVFTVLEDSVRVDTTVVMSNTTTERRSGNTIYYSYFDQFQYVVPIGATELSIVSRGRRLTTTAGQLDEDFNLVSAQLPTQLRSGQSRTIEISFILPVGSIRGESIFFSNAAFQTFPVWSFSDPGTGSLRLRVPENAELGQFGGVLRVVDREDGYVIWEPRDFSVPEDVFSFVTVTVDEALLEESFSVSSQDIVLRTWPGDDVWATFARDTIENGLPTLESLIGIPVPDQKSLEITESVTPYFYGYAGWYDPADTTIEVGNELDDTVMLHELSHAWFNDALFDERWVNEGLAEEFTWLAQRELGWPTEIAPDRPRRTDSGAVPLVEWGNGLGSLLGDEEIRETEEYGYETSWYTVRELVELIGLESMQQVIAAADADTISYVGNDPRETTSMPDDWRRLLDLASQAVSDDPDTEAAIEQLFVNFVLPEDEALLLDERREARQSYQAFTAREPGWRVPAEVRTALTIWDFDSAMATMSEATAVLDRRVEVEAIAQEQELSISEAARLAYELDTPDFGEAMRILDAQATALPAVQELRETYARPLTTNQKWGIGEVDLTPLVEHGERAYSVDQFAEIAAAQRDLDATLAAAETLGAERILWSQIGSAAAGAAVLVVLWAARRRRRARRQWLDSDLFQDDVVLSA
ncbi:MAG: hypothetical protein R8J94_09550 [Acidimicrobiia bacterium]|nr:hypothetical protein [Acidimicrobiia bacterium]